MFEVNLPTPDPSLEKGGERCNHAQQQDIQYSAGAKTLPSVRAGRGLGWVDSPNTAFRNGFNFKYII